MTGHAESASADNRDDISRFTGVKIVLAMVVGIAASGYVLHLGADFVFLENEFAYQIAGLLGATALLLLLALAVVGVLWAVLVVSSR